MLYVQLLTSVGNNTADSSVTNYSITGLNIHEWLAVHSHEYPLLHAHFWNKT